MTIPGTLLVVAVATVLVDQVSKKLITRRLAEARLHPLLGNAGLLRRTNRRPGLIPLSNPAVAIVWIISAAGLVAAIMFSAPLGIPGAISLGLVFGGATSNALERLRRGCVLDFITLGGWRTFNLADVAMVVGTGGAAWAAI